MHPAGIRLHPPCSPASAEVCMGGLELGMPVWLAWDQPSKPWSALDSPLHPGWHPAPHPPCNPASVVGVHLLHHTRYIIRLRRRRQARQRLVPGNGFGLAFLELVVERLTLALRVIKDCNFCPLQRLLCQLCSFGSTGEAGAGDKAGASTRASSSTRPSPHPLYELVPPTEELGP